MGDQSLSELSWLQGVWVGEDGHHIVEEHWSTSRGKTHMGMFRMLKGDDPIFYEFMTIGVEADELVLRIKHFYPGLVGWESKKESVVYVLVELVAAKARFKKLATEDINWLVYHREGDVLSVYFEGEEGGKPEDRFLFRLVND